MCQLPLYTAKEPKTQLPALTPRPVVIQMLRDIAFVLHATRTVKKEILADRELANRRKLVESRKLQRAGKLRFAA